jgi:hypothetical protein
MLSLLTIFAMHVPPENYLRCEDYHWLKNGIQETNLFTPAEKFEIILNWMEHTDPHCFDNKDAND